MTFILDWPFKSTTMLLCLLLFSIVISCILHSPQTSMHPISSLFSIHEKLEAWEWIFLRVYSTNLLMIRTFLFPSIQLDKTFLLLCFLSSPRSIPSPVLRISSPVWHAGSITHQFSSLFTFTFPFSTNSIVKHTKAFRCLKTEAFFRK